MPLLNRETDIFPETLFVPEPSAAPWLVAHVRSRQEKVLARHLVRHEVPFFLPQIEHVTVRNGRKFRSYLPLFPGYVFFRDPGGAPAVLWKSGVAATLVEVPDQGQLHEELRQIHELQAAGGSLRVCELDPGTPVRVTTGAFAGYTGVIASRKGGRRFIVTLSLLKKAVAVEFEDQVLATVRRG